MGKIALLFKVVYFSGNTFVSGNPKIAFRLQWEF